MSRRTDFATFLALFKGSWVLFPHALPNVGRFWGLFIQLWRSWARPFIPLGAFSLRVGILFI